MNEHFIEGIKEFLRVVALAMVSFLLTGTVLNYVVLKFFGSYLSPEEIMIVTGGLTTILKAIDKMYHSGGKSTPLDMDMLDQLKK